MGDIAIPHGLAAAVLVVLTKHTGRWIDEIMLVDRVRSQYIEELGEYPNEGANAFDIMDAASDLADGSLIDENHAHHTTVEEADAGSTFYAWRLRRGCHGRHARRG